VSSSQESELPPSSAGHSNRVADLAISPSLSEQFQAAVRGGPVSPIFFAEDGNRFAFLDGKEETAATIWAADPETHTTAAFIDLDRARQAVEAELDCVFRLGDFKFTSPREVLLRGATAETWEVILDVETYGVRRIPPAEVERGRRSAPRKVRRGVMPFTARAAYLHEIPSPDGRLLLTEQGTNFAIRAVVDDKTHQLTTSGVEGHSWQLDGAIWWAPGAVWSPDSQRLAVARRDTRACANLPVVSFLQTNESVELHPYARAGGTLPTITPALIDVSSRTAREVDLPGEQDQIVIPSGWRHDAAEAYFLTTDRRQKYLRLYAVDARTCEARLVCEETQATFIIGMRRIDRFAPEMILDDDERVLWYSERDGWRHLFLYRTDGTELAQVTSGEFEVLEVVDVDLSTDTVYFTAHSDAARPYDVHVCRAGLDGDGFQQLTTERGVHQAVLTPSKKYLIDTHSSLDRPPATDVLSVEGSVVMTVSRADISRLAEQNLPILEPFTAQAADGKTELHGVLYLPPDFDPSRPYPVVEYQYGGPHHAICPRRFTDGLGVFDLAMGLALQQFVVFTVDGRGSPERGKAFQDISYGHYLQYHVDDH
jgi:Dipeptidyl peptidase IV (DPP IV) N-terminal region